MNAHIQLSRAIGCEFVGRKLKSVMILVSVVTFLVLAVTIWLTTLSAWWWILAVFAILFSLLVIGAFMVANLAVRLLRPSLTEVQTKGVSDFVDKFERVTEHVQTPLFIIMFRIVRDIIRPREKTFIQSATQDSTTLHKDLLALQKLFS